MRLWKHFDLWIVCLLVFGVFAFRHGGEALAAVGPRFSAIQNLVVAKFSAFADSALTPAPGEAAVETIAPVPAGAISESPESGAAVLQATPATPFVADCHEAYHYGYGW